jgi:4-phytase/acid phosphatase
MRGAIIAVAMLATLCGSIPSFAQRLVLDKMVVLMRHGLRPPTSTKDITPFAADPWPSWEVADGQLTPHGAEVASQLGKWERLHFAARGLVSAKGCPKPGEFFIWADGSQQRLVDTANAFANGFYPSCGLATGRLKAGVTDPLFKASETELGKLDISRAKQAIMEKMGGNFDRPKAESAALLGQLQQVLRCCDKTLCETSMQKPSCTLMDLPWSIATIAEGRSIDLRGPLGQGSSIAQVLLLEYGNGKPAAAVGWGRVNGVDIIRLSAIRKLKYEYQERVPYIAQRGASNIANQIRLAMDHPDGNTPGGPPAAKLVVFVGNDTQIAEVGELLNAHWKLPSYLDDETPPTGGLGFELLHDQKTGKRFVRVVFITPKLEQLRHPTTITSTTPPANVAVLIPGCGGPSPALCTQANFVNLLESRIDPAAVATPDYR